MLVGKFVCVVSVIALSVAPVMAAAPKPAPTRTLAKLVNIPHQQFALKNGLRVIVHTDRKAPVVAVSVWYGVGSKHEPKGKTGFAHLFEHLMFNGSENAPGDYFEPLQQVGATDFNGTTWLDRTNYFQTVPTGALERALFLESDRMGHLLGAVTQEKLDNQRGVVQNEKRQGDNQPYGLVEYATFESLFPKGHPYHHSTIGSMADLDSASLDDVKKWFVDNYGPNNAILVLAGDIDMATAKRLSEKYFGDIARGTPLRNVDAPVPTLSAPKSEVMKDRVATTRIHRMWAVPGLNDKHAVPLQAAATILGGLSSSRLDNALVRSEKIAVAVTAEAQIFQHAGVVTVTADVKPGGDAVKVAARLDAVIAEFLRDGPTADELSRASTVMAGRQIRGFEAVGGFGGKATALAEGLLYSNNSNFYKKELQVWASLTPSTVRASAKQWLSRPVYSLTVEPGERTESGAERGGDDGLKVSSLSAPSNYRDPNSEYQVSAPRVAVDRSKLPDVAALASLDFPAIERGKLSNGIEVVFARRTSVPTVLVNVSFDAGFAADPKAALGTQSLMLSLMREGTTTRSSVQIAEESERLGATINTGATLDRTAVSLDALSPNLAASLELLADIVRNPAFEAGEVERLRGQQLARISGEFNNPNAIALRMLVPLLFGAAHPYGVPISGTGDPAVVARVTRAELAAFHSEWLRPDTARIIVVGNTTLASITPLLEKSFGGWKAPAAARPTKSFNVATPAPKSRIVLVDRPKSPQSVISAGEILDAKGRDDLVTLQAANEVLGGSFLSRFNTNLRETKGWSYGVRSQVLEYLESAPFRILAPVQADKTGDSIKELLNDMKAFLTDKGVTAAELERTVNGNVRELPGSFETSGAVLGGVLNIVNFARPDDYYEKLAGKYTAMTAAEIDAAGRAKLDPAKLLFVVVGDASVVKPQLEQLGLPVEVIAAPVLK
ncbi:MAG: pitrilysin family protein [Alphaproteobacteria bacterium]|nr:pitrilysin family protein [Alphaproteobacteria bacterium]